MAYEAMLAGLEMKPFWNGIQVEDVAPNEVFKDSMTRFYTLLEYTNFTWEDHSEDRPLFLTVVGDKVELPLRKTSRSLVSLFRVHPISNKGYKCLALQTLQTDLQPPKIACICLLAQAETSQGTLCTPSQVMDQSTWGDRLGASYQPASHRRGKHERRYTGIQKRLGGSSRLRVATKVATLIYGVVLRKGSYP